MFKVGDTVSYSPKNHKAKVIRAFPNEDQYMVEWEDNQLIPPQMKVPGAFLTLLEAEIEVCPRCGTKWTETPIGHKLFYDCLKCNLKREDA